MIERFRKIHPVYSPQDRLWYSDDGYDTSAKSLHELQGKLPGTKIVGYCPNGYVIERVKHKFPPEMTRALTAYGRSTPLSLPQHRHRSPALEPGQIRFVAPESGLEDEVTAVDDTDIDANKPVPELGVAEFRPITKLRQLRHPIVDWSRWPEQMLRNKLATTSVIELADQIHCTRNALIGRLHRLEIVISEVRGTQKQRLSPRDE